MQRINLQICLQLTNDPRRQRVPRNVKKICEICRARDGSSKNVPFADRSFKEFNYLVKRISSARIPMTELQRRVTAGGKNFAISGVVANRLASRIRGSSKLGEWIRGPIAGGPSKQLNDSL